MAKRPVFVPRANLDHLVEEIDVEFEWHPGFAPIQKKKNVEAMHHAAKTRNLSPLLEVSTKSEDLIGQRLSAFNLKIETTVGPMSIESAYQGSKVFRRGGPYTDIYEKSSREAKRDIRTKESGPLVGFSFFGEDWPLEPASAFYDWLYLSALRSHQGFLRKLFAYKGFTDIEFNPERSVNCQARTCAMLVSLLKLKLLDDALQSQEHFIRLIWPDAQKRPVPASLNQRPLGL